ncbi:hypothetical protein [Streptomyces misionensis]
MTTQQPEPDRTPRANQILAEPATVERCQADYQAAADIRQNLAAQEARHR